MKATLFLGGGRITGALVAGLRLAGDRRRIVVYDRHPEKLRALRRKSKVEIARDLKSNVESAEMVIVAVRPASIEAMLKEVVDCGANSSAFWISLAAGIPLRNLKRWSGRPVRWARAMPSPVCRIGRGLTPLCFERSVPKSERAQVRKLFKQVGLVLDLPEKQMDAITATHSPTHGYHALATLAKAAQDAGLDRKTALIAAAHGLGNGIEYWRERGESLEALLHEAATPGGIAASTMEAMNQAGFQNAVARGVLAGIDRARKNAKF
ncbi:MAG TPA: NAD(P)-binding domain-containing protein [Verrucomicrobiae bacterium]|nr:NAD(P)-binding domain-containing protein [Verrucomicrobiae bacterium]